MVVGSAYIKFIIIILLSVELPSSLAVAACVQESARTSHKVTIPKDLVISGPTHPSRLQRREGQRLHMPTGSPLALRLLPISRLEPRQRAARPRRATIG